MREYQNNISVSGNIWKYPIIDERIGARLVQQAGVSDLVARILAGRGLTADTVEDFLTPTLKKLMPDPSSLKDMDKSADRLADAVMKGEKVGIIGDYDVDGATSSAVLRLFLESYGLKTLVHIPDREEGYGPSDQAFEEFSAEGISFVVTTDCGTSAFEVLNRATEKGFDVIVLDHHEAEARLPHVLAVVNPKRLDEDHPYDYLAYMAAVGVVFLTVIAIQRELRRRGFFKDRPETNLMDFLDLVALGTVCDVVPLLGLNRAYVRQGLKIMAQRKNPGIRALCDVAGISEAPDSYHLGYILGPRINAGGRVGDSSAGNRLLCTKDTDEAKITAETLNNFNNERKEIEGAVLLQAIEDVESHPAEYPMAFVAGKNWHQGVIGIVAGKLKERYNLPAFVMSIEDDEVKGSSRSVSGIDVGALIMAGKEKGILTKGGGHIMAAGFSLNEKDIDRFYHFAGEYIRQQLGEEKPVPELRIDGVLNAGGATLALAEELRMMEPFGASNPEPRIVLENVRIRYSSVVGSANVRCTLVSDLGATVNAIAFRCADTTLGTTLLNSKGQKFNVAGSLRINTWNGRTSVQFIIEDLMEKL